MKFWDANRLFTRNMFLVIVVVVVVVFFHRVVVMEDRIGWRIGDGG